MKIVKGHFELRFDVLRLYKSVITKFMNIECRLIKSNCNIGFKKYFLLVQFKRKNVETQTWSEL